MTHEGDLALSSTGDLQTTNGIGEILQSITLRMKTNISQYRLRQTLGNSLTSLVGQFLTQDTLRSGENLIYAALSGDKLLSSVSVEVRGIPINKTQAVFIISVTGSDIHGLYSIPFDFQHGIVEPRSNTVSSIGSSPISN